MSSGLTSHAARSQPGSKDVQQWLVQERPHRAYAAGSRETSVIVSQNVFGQLATQQYIRATVARQESYEQEPVYYASLAAAKKGAAKRCTAMGAA